MLGFKTPFQVRILLHLAPESRDQRRRRPSQDNEIAAPDFETAIIERYRRPVEEALIEMYLAVLAP